MPLVPPVIKADLCLSLISMFLSLLRYQSNKSVKVLLRLPRLDFMSKLWNPHGMTQRTYIPQKETHLASLLKDSGRPFAPDTAARPGDAEIVIPGRNLQGFLLPKAMHRRHTAI